QPAQIGLLIVERAAEPGSCKRQAGAHEGSLMRETHVIPCVVGRAELIAAQPRVRRRHPWYDDGGRRVQFAGEYSGAQLSGRVDGRAYVERCDEPAFRDLRREVVAVEEVHHLASGENAGRDEPGTG